MMTVHFIFFLYMRPCLLNLHEFMYVQMMNLKKNVG